MTEHIIITYSSEMAQSGHVDPNFTHLVYRDSNQHGNVLRRHLQPGSYLFFNTRIGRMRYIMAYFYMEKILKGETDREEIQGLRCSAQSDEVIIIGDRSFSKVLTAPLPFDRDLIQNMPYRADDRYFESKSTNGASELEAIKDKTLNPTVINDEEKNLLLRLCENRGRLLLWGISLDIQVDPYTSEKFNRLAERTHNSAETLEGSSYAQGSGRVVLV